jgi:hypothetical protein
MFLLVEKFNPLILAEYRVEKQTMTHFTSERKVFLPV